MTDSPHRTSRRRVLQLLCGSAAGAGTALAAQASPHILTASVVAQNSGKGAKKMRVYFGTYTNRDKSKGIYTSELDLETGRLTDPVLAAEVVNPSFLALHPNGRYLYAVGEIDNFNGKKAGAVSAFSIDRATGKLTLLNQQESKGTGPCYVTVDSAGKNALVANYGSGSVAVLPIAPDGKLREASASVQHQGSSADARRQEGPHAHSIQVDPTGRYVLSADLGLDKVLVYRFDPGKGTLTANDPAFGSVAPGAGPRHFSFHPSARYVYVINEMGSTVTAFQYDSGTGRMTELHTLSTLPEGAKPPNQSTAEVVVHPSGKFLYGSNRGHDSIAIFRIDESTGRLTPAGHQPTQGRTPRNFGIDPTGRYLLAANQGTDSVVVFRIDPQTGALTPTGQALQVGTPVCVRFLAQ